MPELIAREVPNALSSNKELFDIKNYDIKIRFLSSGCIVGVGCKEIAFETKEKAMEELNKYIANPTETAEKWEKIFKNS